MPMPLTHAIYTAIAIDLYRDHISHHKELFTRWAMAACIIGSIFPDTDVLLHYIFASAGYTGELFIHRGITHTFAFSSILLIIAILLTMKHKQPGICICLFTCGVILHNTMDFFIGWPEPKKWVPFWPVLVNSLSIRTVLNENLTSFIGNGITCIILILWIFHEETVHSKNR